MFSLQLSHSTAKEREKMWGAYHRLRTADKFLDDWRVFLSTSIGCKALPSFYQFVTHNIFRKMIKVEYLVVENADASNESPSRYLTHVEQNALRYVAGYVVRKLRNQLELSSHPQKDEMILLLMECAGDELDESNGTEMWTNMVDRGGLWHVNDQTYSLFAIMEEEVRKFYTLSRSQATRNTVVQTTLQSNDYLSGA